VPDSIQRIKLTIASYNCGYEHVRDAQSLAVLKGLDAHCWDNNVDQMILALSYPKNYTLDIVSHGYVRGLEPYNYVAQVFDRYRQYASFID
jgi:membrane-bound lytic murein transglycosylase F